MTGWDFLLQRQLPNRLPLGLLEQSKWLESVQVDPRSGVTSMVLVDFDRDGSPFRQAIEPITDETAHRASQTLLLANLDALRMANSHGHPRGHYFWRLPTGNGHCAVLKLTHKADTEKTFENGATVDQFPQRCYFASRSQWQSVSIHRPKISFINYSVSFSKQAPLEYPKTLGFESPGSYIEATKADLVPLMKGNTVQTRYYRVVYWEGRQVDDLGLAIRHYFGLGVMSTLDDLALAITSRAFHSGLYQTVGEVCEPYVIFPKDAAPQKAFLLQNNGPSTLLRPGNDLISRLSKSRYGKTKYRIHFGIPYWIDDKLLSSGCVEVEHNRLQKSSIKLYLTAEPLYYRPFDETPHMPLPESLAHFWSWSVRQAIAAE